MDHGLLLFRDHVHEIAATPVVAVAVFAESYTFLSFVLRIGRIILPELMIAMCELAFFLVRTVTILGEFFAEL